MRKVWLLFFIFLLLLLLFPASVAQPAEAQSLAVQSAVSQSKAQPAQPAHNQIRGEYIETRSADIYTGPCFANGEMGLAGDEAILAWHITSGSWDNVSLAGLTIAAAVKAQSTLGDPYGEPYPAKSVLLVDNKASYAQRSALIAFAQEMGGELLRNIVHVKDVPISMDVVSGHSGRAVLHAGTFATVETRGIEEKDHICGNETTYYPPLTETAHAMPAVALTDQYQGDGLNASWTLHDKRSAFVGSFVR